MSDPKLEDCPQDSCKGKVKRMLGTGAGLIFKGSGFYQTDYRSDSYKKGESKDSGKKDSGKKDSGKKDSGKKGSNSDAKTGSPEA